MSPENKKVLEKVVNYVEDEEYDHLVEYLYNSDHYNEELDQPDFSAMTSEDLYDFCIENNIEHIWTNIFELKTYLDSVK